MSSIVQASEGTLSRVVLYATRTCGYCWAAEALLTERGIQFEKIDVSSDPATRKWLLEATQRRTVPQIFIDGRSIGGFTELAALDRNGKLDQLLRGVSVG
jgi:glutaredoxin 3